MALTKDQFKHQIFFHINQISSDRYGIWMLFFYRKNGKIQLKISNRKALFLKYFSLFIQLYIAKVLIGSWSSENFPDPTKKVWIRHNPDPQPWYEKHRLVRFSLYITTPWCILRREVDTPWCIIRRQIATVPTYLAV